MGKDDLMVLKADIATQMTLIKDVANRLEERALDIQPDDIVRMESVAYQIHNLYSAVEDLFKLVASHFENSIADSSRWHTELLYRMSQEITGVRPALLSQECYLLLNGLRSFRHFFRHAYNVPMEYPQLEINLDKARQIYPCLDRDVTHFLQKL